MATQDRTAHQVGRQQPIYEAARECDRLFELCLTGQPKGQESIAQNHRRFRLWVAYLGVFARQNASLDTRLIDNPEVRELILLLLSVLQRNLGRAIQRRHASAQRFEANLSDDVEQKILEEPFGSINTPQGPIYGISGAVDRLHRLAIRTRISSTDNQNLEKKITHFAKKFKSDGFDSLVLLVLKYKFPQAEEKLLHQLARSIIYRRQRLLYGRYHQKKLSYDRDSKAPPIKFSQPDKLQQQEQYQEIEVETKLETRKETESTFKSARPEDVSETDPTLFKIEEFQRHQPPPKSTAETLISTGSSSWAGKVTYPRLPKVQEGSSHASCPFCFQEHPLGDFEDPRWWKKHVDGDLQQFVCISEDCSDSLYHTASSHTWLNHMTTNHSMDWPQYIHVKREWRCPFTIEEKTCKMTPFTDSSSLEKHLSDSHSMVLRGYDLKTLAQKSSAAVPRDPDICPLCVSTIDHQLDQTQDSTANDQQDHPLKSKSKKSVKFATAVATSIKESKISSNEDLLRKRMAKHIARHLKTLSFISIRGLELDDDNDSDSQAMTERPEMMGNSLEVDTEEDQYSTSKEPLLYCDRDSCDCVDRKKNSTVDWSSLGATFKSAAIIPEIKPPTSHDDPSYGLTKDAQSEWAFWYPLSINRKKIGPSEYRGHTNDEKLISYFQIDTKETTEQSDTSRAEPSLDNLAIRKLWNRAWNKLREEDSALIEEYEAKLQGSVVAGLRGILKSNSNIGELLSAILPSEIEEANTNAAKSVLSSSEDEIKEAAELVLAVVGSANSYVTQAVSANPYASIAWAGVIFLLPVSTIASAQSASLAKGLNYISHLISQSYTREEFYVESYEPWMDSQEEFRQLHHAYKDTLERLYRQILRFQARSYCYYPNDSDIRHGLDASKSSHWEQLLNKVHERNGDFIEVERTWKQIKSDLHQPSNLLGPVAAEVEKEACLRSLSSEYMDERKEDISLAHPETCDWFFETRQFQQWYRRDNLENHNGVLWIKGHPGTGKSTLMKHTLGHLEKELSETHVIAAHFFNARGDDSEQTPLSMLRSLLYQLLEKEPSIYEQFLPLFRNKKQKFDTHWKWREPDLKNFLLSTIQNYQSKPLIILVDALDECEEAHVRDAVGLLEELSIKALGVGLPLNICLSSRHYPHIGMRKHLKLALENMKEHDVDIRKYTWDNLTIKDEEIEGEILEKASGVFMWAVLVIKLLNKVYDEGHIEAMHKTLHDVPRDLEHVFEALLIKDNPDKRETVFMLQFVLLAKRLLKPEELYFATLAKTSTERIKPWDRSRITPNDIRRRITNSSRGLIEVRQGKRNAVQFIHKSVNDFLTRNKRLQKLDPDLKFNALGSLHERLRSFCMTYIMMEPFQSATHRKQAKALGSIYPFLEYASVYLLAHAEEADKQQVGQADFLEYLLEEPNVLEKIRLLHNTFEEYPGTGCARGVNLLHMLAFHGYSRLTKALLDKKVNINAQAGVYGNALQAAAAKGNTEIAELLIKEGADVNAQGGFYGNALQAASFKGHKEIVELLLKEGADVNARGGQYGYALHAAALWGNEETLEMLLKEGADVNAQASYFGYALHAAAVDGHQEIIEILLKEGADVNTTGGYSGSAVQAAASMGHKEIVEILLIEGADVNAQGGHHGNALCEAASGNIGTRDRKLIKKLLQKGADVNAQGGFYGNALQAATSVGDTKLVRILLKKGADVNAQGGPYGNALCAAAIEGEAYAVQLLLESGADVNSKTEIYGNALQAATIRGDEEIVKLLVEAGADTNPPESYFNPGLQAAFTPQTEVQLLEGIVQQRVLVTPSAKSALRLFFKIILSDDTMREECMEILFRENIETNNQWIYDHCCYLAIVFEDVDNAARLVEKGAIPNPYIKNYPTGLPYAMAVDAEEVVAALLDNGADINGPMFYTEEEAGAQIPELHTYQYPV